MTASLELFKVSEVYATKIEMKNLGLGIRQLVNPVRIVIVLSSYKGSRMLCFFLPQGWTTDGASIPKVFEWLIGKPFEKKHLIPALIHDALYGSHYLLKEDSDYLFKLLLDYERVSSWKSSLMYQSVNWFGGNAWNSSNNYSVSEARKFIGFQSVHNPTPEQIKGAVNVCYATTR